MTEANNECAIKLQDVSVKFKQDQRTVTAVKDVSLTVAKGDIYGIVGYSGAGKSTLVRVINLLQEPSSGSVIVNGQDMLSLSSKELRDARRKIGMIFQHFNLMNARTVAGNVAYPLHSIGMTKSAINKKVAKLLELVGLTDRKNAYPSQLSGGQKQRVAIARALANDPDILISDEATSALDPKTTNSILALLKSLNEKLGLTIILITHEMQAVKEICRNVAVMEKGKIIERGDLLSIFSDPQKPLTQEFIATANPTDQAIDELVDEDSLANLGDNQVAVELKFVGDATDQPIIIELYKRHSVVASILNGNVENLDGVSFGTLLVILTGDQQNIRAALNYLAHSKIETRLIATGAQFNDLAKGDA